MVVFFAVCKTTMQATVIDTLRYAVRLKEAGVEPAHAEAMSRALNDELTEGLATKADLDGAVTGLNARFDALEARFDAKFDAVDANFDSVDAKFEAVDARFEAVDARFEAVDARFDAMDTKFDAMDTKFDAMDTKFDAMDTKFDALGKQVGIQGRYMFLVLAVVVALGLYNATVPRLGKGPSQPTPTTAAMVAAELPSSGAPDGYLHGRTPTGVPAVADR